MKTKSNKSVRWSIIEFHFPYMHMNFYEIYDKRMTYYRTDDNKSELGYTVKPPCTTIFL